MLFGSAIDWARGGKIRHCVLLHHYFNFLVLECLDFPKCSMYKIFLDINLFCSKRKKIVKRKREFGAVSLVGG